MSVKQKLTFTARGYEIDSYGHVNNAVYLNYFEHARWEYFRELGLYDLIRKIGINPVVTDIQIRYQREVRLFDELTIESTCKPEGPYLVFQQRLFNNTTQLQSARSTTKLIFLNKDNIAQDVPEEILALTQNLNQ